MITDPEIEPWLEYRPFDFKTLLCDLSTGLVWGSDVDYSKQFHQFLCGRSCFSIVVIIKIYEKNKQNTFNRDHKSREKHPSAPPSNHMMMPELLLDLATNGLIL
jgi:hypothetical protein